MRRVPLIAALIVLLAASLLFWRGQNQINSLRKEKQKAELSIMELEAEIDKAHGRVSAQQKSTDIATKRRNAAMALLSKARAERTGNGPESEWVEPPTLWPQWEPASRYVWISKDLLKELPMVPFESNGEIRRDVAAMLALSKDQQQRINSALSRIVADNKKLEAESAQLTTNHLESGEGEKVTLIVAPDYESSTRLRAQYESALRTNLGTQQSELIQHLGRYWLTETFPGEVAQPKIISAVRRTDGSYGVTIRGPNQWSTTSGFLKLDQYVPPNLLPFFSPLFESGSGAPQPN